MSIKFLGVAKFIFKISCFITVIFMITIWIKKFVEDEDLCLVEYKSFGRANDIELPDLSLCISDPFDEHKLRALGTTTDAYRAHLAGNGFNESLTNVNYTDVIFNIGGYYNVTLVLYKNGSYGDVVGTPSKSRLATFFYDMFADCYGIDMDHLSMQEVTYENHMFIRDPNLQEFLTSRTVYAVAHGRHRIMLANSLGPVSFDRNSTYGGNVGVVINDVEVVRKRDKSRDPCVTQRRSWHESALLKHAKPVGCFPPYLKTHHYLRICSTKKEMMN